MTLNKVQADIIKKYSFITNTSINGGNLNIYYFKSGQEQVRKVPLRVGFRRLLDEIQKIKKDIGVSVYGKAQQSDSFVI